MKLGIFLGYGPRQLEPNQGISRLIGLLILGALRSPGIEVTVAGAGWIKEDIDRLLVEFGIDRSSVEVVTTKGQPLGLTLLERSKRLRPLRVGRMQRWAERIVAGITGVLVVPLATRSVVVLVLMGAVGVVLGALLLIPALILLVTAGAAYLAVRLTRRLWGASDRLRIVRKVKEIWRNGLLAAGVQDRVRESEISRLVRILNKRRDIGVWYVPSMFWPEVSQLTGKIVMGAPDIVLYDFPLQFRDEGGRRALARVEKSLRVADHLICYSENVRQNHLIGRNGIPPDRVSVIRHGNVDLSEQAPATREDSLDTLHSFLKVNQDRYSSYLRGFRFDDVEFIFYSSQVRPYKNVEGLVAVFDRILREHYRPLKLVVTGRLSHNERLQRLVAERGLERDVLSISAVPNDVLASLYKLARLSVNPTQFEGGFPFTFSEAFSVGTPSLMSRIPAVEETIDDRSLLESMTFYPRDREHMLERILWGLDNREELLRLQQPLYERLASRTWRVVADDYLRIIQAVASSR